MGAAENTCGRPTCQTHRDFVAMQNSRETYPATFCPDKDLPVGFVLLYQQDFRRIVTKAT